MTKTIATGILFTYLIILFGYGLSSLTHIWLHAVQNSAHSHTHNETENIQFHSIDDHSKTLSKINEGNQDVGDSETNTIVFSFVFWKKAEPELFNFNADISKELYSIYLDSYRGLCSAPNTPPPLS